MAFDDDFKISMDDIKDIVSELFGEKIEKIDESKAKEILKQEEKIYLDKDLESLQIGKLTEEEEKILQSYENEVKEDKKEEVKQVNIEELRQQIESEVREKLRKEMEEERARKREEVLKKLEGVKEPEAELKKTTFEQTITNYSEKISLLQIFEQSQNIFKNLLSKLIKRTPVETMFLKTLEKVMLKYPDVLRKADHNQYNKIRVDGSIEIGRVAANINAINMPEKQKEEKFFKALHDVFEERLIATELAVGIATKDEIISKLLLQMDQVFEMKKFPQRLKDIFIEKIVPSTTVKQGE